MQFAKCLLALLLVAPGAAAQNRLSHPLQAFPDPSGLPAHLSAAPDTVRLLAVRVQFQTDTDAGTTGDGRFDLQATTDSTLDAPPHDARYFRDHLLFLENYFRKVSRGRTTVRTALLDSVVTLSAPMSAYSPARDEGPDRVAALARDAWRAVDSLRLVPDFSAYSCFLIFHAGVGRDVDLVSTLGYDPGPRDIPSLTFGLDGFRKVFGGAFAGFPVAGGTFHITNSLVLPATERRLLPGATGDVPLTLGINGLLCASMGSYLGLPDLFNTATGRSGIGRFGLMDGQAIFSFAGAFPPEPSAWEKIWLGWTEPITVSGPTPLVLPAIGFGSIQPFRQDTVYRVPLSATEYLLVENRNRDPERNGQRITMSVRGVTQFLQRPYDTDDFYAYDIPALRGVVTDVEDFDWSLPGGYDRDDAAFYDGGIVIWHIDDAAVRAGLGTNGVNADPARRGVDVEEADGSQDIGESYDSFTPGSGSEEGTALDFWYRGNASPVNINAYSPTSHPDSRTNTGAATGVTIRDFTARGARMSCFVELGGTIRPLPGFPKRTNGQFASAAIAVAAAQQGGAPVIVAATSGSAATVPIPPGLPAIPAFAPKVFAWNLDGTPALPGGREDGLCDSATTPVRSEGIALSDADGDGTREVLLLRSGERSLLALSLTTLSGGFSQRIRSLPAPSSGSFPVVTDSAFFVASTALHRFGKNGIALDSVAIPGDTIAGVSRGLVGSQIIVVTAQGKILLLSGAAGGTMQIVRQRDFGGRCTAPAVSGLLGGARAGGAIAFVTAEGLLYLADNELNTFPGFPVPLGEPAVRPPAIADIDGYGGRDIVIATATQLHVVNAAGARVDGFPVQLADSTASAPIVADCDGDGKAEIVVITRSGLVSAFTGRGKMLQGFPLAAGVGEQWPAVVLSGDSIVLVVASSSDGSVSGWRTGTSAGSTSAGAFPWAQYQRDAERSGSELSIPLAPGLRDEFFPAERVYNWPNPVYGGKTYLRYYLRADAEIRITVYDLAGDLVAEFPGPGTGGMDNEVAWDVSGVASGVYFAHIEASGSGGNGKAIVKVAVVK